MSRSSMYRAGAALLLAGVAVACGGNPPAAVGPVPLYAPGATVDRMTIRTAQQAVVVESPLLARQRVERIVQEVGGYLENSSGGGNGDVRIEGRVPAARLDSVMNEVAALGKERRRHTTGSDITDQYTDLEARLRSNVALRDRLQQLLTRAGTLDEVLKLEKEIARLQSDIDALQARLDQLKSRVELASLSIDLETKHVLGPVAVVGKGLWWLGSKLFVIR